MRHPHVLQLIIDSLRYWVSEMHVDGFRFDLAASLARQFHEVDRLSAFFDLIQVDPVVSQVKLIAEPWDLGEGGYQVGNFPTLWSEWNGRYRDTVRDYWRGADRTLADFAYRLTGSSDLYGRTGRHPYASVNFVTAHDGFTLTDLVSYDFKHNEANGEENRDGTDDNRSWNSGVEGPTDDPEVLRLRSSRRRALMTTLLLSTGRADAAARRRARPLPGRQQQRLLPGQRDLLARLGERGHRVPRLLRRAHRLPAPPPGLPAAPLLRGRAHPPAASLSDIGWFRPDGKRDDRRRLAGRVRQVARASSSTATRCPTRTRAAAGSPTTASCCCSTGTHGDVTFVLPGRDWGRRWMREFEPRAPSPRSGRGRPGPRSTSPPAASRCSGG